MRIAYTLADGAAGSTITFVLDGVPRTITDSHANFRPIREHLLSDNHDPIRLRHLLDVQGYAQEELRRLSDRVTYRDGTILFDGARLEKPITRQMVRLLREGADPSVSGGNTSLNDPSGPGALSALVRFLENLATNPSAESRRHLYSWLEGRDFTITSEGEILAYKGVRAVESNESVTAGVEQVQVTMNGVSTIHVGHIPNPVGATIEMPRSLVNAEREHGCSVGLHVGTYGYARDFGQRLLHVVVNPRDVVSVPSDSKFQKMRVARYRVLGVSNGFVEFPLVDSPDYDADAGAGFTDDDLDDDEPVGAKDEPDGFVSPDGTLPDDERERDADCYPPDPVAIVRSWVDRLLGRD